MNKFKPSKFNDIKNGLITSPYNWKIKNREHYNEY